jgi:myo-inositol 2-dehydrogenase/D-chiro-inositol 1-dehydrogenase
MTLRIGMLSFAHYHANFWSEAFSADPRVSLVGVWDDDASRLQTAANAFAMQPFGDIENLLASVDAVAICSETARHRRLVEAAARRGLAILCEKSLAASMEDAIAIEAAVGDRGVKFMQSFPKRLDPASIRIRDLVQSGELGEIRLVRVRHGHNHGREPSFTNGWWTKPELSGGGTLIDEGVHAFDFLRWLFGNPQTIQATVSSFEGLAVEDAAIAMLRWDNGLLAEVATSWSFAAGHDSVEVYGSKATVLLAGVDLASRDLSGPSYLRLARHDAVGWETFDVVPRFVAGGFHQAVASAFADYVLGASEPPSSVEDGRAALAIVVAAYTSARNAAAITISY